MDPTRGEATRAEDITPPGLTLPAVYASEDRELVCVLGPIPELNYPIYLLVHKLRNVGRVKALFYACELKPVVMTGAMKNGKRGACFSGAGQRATGRETSDSFR
jgi:hypothetical protein